jgi:hypothetical protein
MALLNIADRIYLGANLASNVYVGATRVWPNFRPTDLAGCTVWLDASSLKLTDGATVPTWPNLGAGPAPTLLGSPAPTFRANALNTDKPVVRITQGQGLYRLAGHSADKDYTLVYVGRRWKLSTGRVIAAQDTAANLLIGYHGNEMDVCYIEAWITPSASPSSTTAWRLYSADSTSTAVARFFVNGVLLASGTATPTKGWGGTLCINGYTNDADVALAQSTDCEIAELVLYDRKLSDAERQQVEDYLRTKWDPIKPFHPSDIGTNLLGWFDASDAATVQIAGSGVSNWINKGVGGMTLAQSTDAYRPTYVSSRYVNFAQGQILDPANAPAAFDFIVAGQPNPPAQWRTLLRSVGAHEIIIEDTATRYGVYSGGFNPAGGLTWDPLDGIGYVRAAASAVPTMSRDGGTMTSTGVALAATSPAPTMFGAYAGAPPTQAWGRVYEAMFVPYNTEYRQMLEGYLAHKWGLQSLLPVDHPYKTTPP